MPRDPDSIVWLRWAIDVVALLATVTSAIIFWYRRWGSRHWPITHGTVEYGMTSDMDGWKTNLVYSYAVDAEFYSGLYPLKARNEAHADNQARAWKGQSLAVRYSPRDPAISAVRMEDQSPLMLESFPEP